MSHVAQVDVQIKDLDALRAACTALGLEFRENQKTYRWWGRHVGDYPLPAGFSAEDMGQCDHAIRIPGNDRAYEVGICKRRDGKEGFAMLFDFFNGGYGLQEVIGKDACKLRQMYAAKAAEAQARKEGYRVQSKVGADGKIRLLCTR